MEARTVNNPPAAAPHDDAVRCVLAIELSKKSWIVAFNTPLSEKISRYTLEACDWRELLKLCERIRTRIARELKKDVELVSCSEAGYDGLWRICVVNRRFGALCACLVSPRRTTVGSIVSVAG